MKSLFAPLAALWVVSCGGSSGGGPGAEAAPVSASLSTVVAPVSKGIPSDGVAAATLEITVLDPGGLPVGNRKLTVQPTGAQNSVWPAPGLTTNAAGRAEARVTSTVPGVLSVLVAVDDPGGSPVTLLDQPELEFVEPSVPRKRVSVSSSGQEANDFNGQPAVSGNGRWIAFQSKAFNLVPGDTNQKEDVFLHDLLTGTTERVSLTPVGGQFTDLCGQPSLSDDGSLVAFEGRQSDDDAIFLRDRLGGFTLPISDATSLDGRCFDPALSGDGRWIAFVCNDGESQQVWVADRITVDLSLVSQSSAGEPGDGPSRSPSISRDGRWVVFASTADNLVAGDSNEKDDVFLHDRQSGQTQIVSTNVGGGQGDDDSVEPWIAADGRWVAFSSKAENLVPADDNGKSDVFVKDTQTGAIQRVSLDPQGSEVDKESWQPVLSADGTYVVFSSLSDDLVAEDSNGKEDVFRRDLVTNLTVRVSLALGGEDPDEFSSEPALASDAPVVAFTSKAGNLVSSDENDKTDVFSAPRD